MHLSVVVELLLLELLILTTSCLSLSTGLVWWEHIAIEVNLDPWMCILETVQEN